MTKKEISRIFSKIHILNELTNQIKEFKTKTIYIWLKNFKIILYKTNEL